MQFNDNQSPINQPTDRRFTVQEAAKVLGITPEAVRGRIQRGTLPKEKGEDGTVYVRLTVDQTSDESQSIGDATANESPLVEALQERIEHLTQIIETRDEEIRRRDTIIMTMAQRIPELEPAREAPPDPRDGPETASEEPGKGGVGSEQEKPVSWWKRLFSA